MNRKIIGLLAFLVSISLTQITFADSNTSKASCSCKNKLYKKLDLTPEQQTQINIREIASFKVWNGVVEESSSI
jgi:hypothetical protein